MKIAIPAYYKEYYPTGDSALANFLYSTFSFLFTKRVFVGVHK